MQCNVSYYFNSLFNWITGSVISIMSMHKIYIFELSYKEEMKIHLVKSYIMFHVGDKNHQRLKMSY